jgi:hypothetical protein
VRRPEHTGAGRVVFVQRLRGTTAREQTAPVSLMSTVARRRPERAPDGRPTTTPPDAGVALLREAGVVLIVLAPGQVVVSGFSRNLERVARTLTRGRAQLLIAHGSEWLDVEVTPAFLRRERRTAWAVGGATLDIDLEPLPGLDFGALLLDALPQEPEDEGPPWACPTHRAQIAARRAATWPGAAVYRPR